MKLLKTCAALSLSALLVFTGCGAPGSTASGAGSSAPASAAEGSSAALNTEPIKIATKPMTEQFILGEMLGLLIEENTDYTVEITKGIGGGTSNIMPAMEKGEFDLYPEYTSSGWVLVLGHGAKEVDDKDMLAKLQQEYTGKYDMSWLGLYGFNNTYTLAVRGEAAHEYNLKTCSDLAAVADKLVFGGNPDYIEREDGFPAVCEAYGLHFKNVVDIDIGLKYQALASGDIDVTNAYTTDAQLGAADVVALQDDLGFQVNYYCSTVVRNDALAAYPGLKEALSKMDGLLTDQEMAKLNAAVEVDGRDEKDVAREFLVGKGLIGA